MIYKRYQTVALKETVETHFTIPPGVIVDVDDAAGTGS